MSRPECQPVFRLTFISPERHHDLPRSGSIQNDLPQRFADISDYARPIRGGGGASGGVRSRAVVRIALSVFGHFDSVPDLCAGRFGAEYPHRLRGPNLAWHRCLYGGRCVCQLQLHVARARYADIARLHFGWHLCGDCGHHFRPAQLANSRLLPCCVDPGHAVFRGVVPDQSAMVYQ